MIAIEMEAMERMPEQDDDFDVVRQALVAKAMVAGYARWWGNPDDHYDDIEVEKPFSRAVEIKGQRVDLLGREDVRCTQAGVPTVIDHKSTQRAPFVWSKTRAMTQNPQALMYAWDEFEAPDFNGDVVQVIWDFVKKPGGDPRKTLTKAQKAMLEAGEYYFKKGIEAHICEWALENGCENLQLWSYRCTQDMFDKPDKYFTKFAFDVTRDQVDLFKREVTADWVKRQMYARNDFWPRHGNRCEDFGACDFLPICHGEHVLEGNERYNHREPKQEKPYLSASGLQTLRDCPKKYDFQYIQGFKKAKKKESLLIGDILHQGLNAFWRNGQEPLEEQD